MRKEKNIHQKYNGYEGAIDKTPIQKQIEMVVTNGLGYDTRTRFLPDTLGRGVSSSRYNSVLYGGVVKYGNGIRGIREILGKYIIDYAEELIKNTPHGLRAHLAELELRTNPSGELEQIVEELKRQAINSSPVRDLLLQDRREWSDRGPLYLVQDIFRGKEGGLIRLVVGMACKESLEEIIMKRYLRYENKPLDPDGERKKKEKNFENIIIVR